jgi:hypothetical protein
VAKIQIKSGKKTSSLETSPHKKQKTNNQQIINTWSVSYLCFTFIYF